MFEIFIIFRSVHFDASSACRNFMLKGDVRLKQLYSMVGYNDVSNSNLKVANEESNGSSWLHIKDDFDKRGRVGQEWPWSRA